METWLPVLGYEGLYEVSELGNVRRIARGKVLSAKTVVAAKQMLAEQTTLKQVAEFFGVSIATAHNIKTGKTWVGDEAYRPISLQLDSSGYLQCCLCKDGKYTKRSVHRMVWEAFCGPIQGRLEINHKDLDRANNVLANLELVTHQQNIKHAIDAYKSQGLLRAKKGVKGFIAGKHSKYA